MSKKHMQLAILVLLLFVYKKTSSTFQTLNSCGLQHDNFSNLRGWSSNKTVSAINSTNTPTTIYHGFFGDSGTSSLLREYSTMVDTQVTQISLLTTWYDDYYYDQTNGWNLPELVLWPDADYTYHGWYYHLIGSSWLSLNRSFIYIVNKHIGVVTVTVSFKYFLVGDLDMNNDKMVIQFNSENITENKNMSDLIQRDNLFETMYIRNGGLFSYYYNVSFSKTVQPNEIFTISINTFFSVNQYVREKLWGVTDFKMVSDVANIQTTNVLKINVSSTINIPSTIISNISTTNIPLTNMPRSTVIRVENTKPEILQQNTLIYVVIVCVFIIGCMMGCGCILIIWFLNFQKVKDNTKTVEMHNVAAHVQNEKKSDNSDNEVIVYDNDDEKMPSLNKIQTLNSEQLYEKNQDIDDDNETETKQSCVVLNPLDSELLYERKEGDPEDYKILETLYEDVINTKQDKMDATTKNKTDNDPNVTSKLNKTTTGAQNGDI
eukprot:373258_1